MSDPVEQFVCALFDYDDAALREHPLTTAERRLARAAMRKIDEVRAEERERGARIADEHRERAKAMQSGLLEKRDPVYGIGTADSKQWDQFQHGAGAAAAIAAAIRGGDDAAKSE